MESTLNLCIDVIFGVFLSDRSLYLMEYKREEESFSRTQHRPVLALSYDLIKTYKYINKVYHKKKAEENATISSGGPRTGPLNNGYDDENYDYIFQVFVFILLL